MISYFSVLGDFYHHEEYDTESSLWHSYPWLVGADNRVQFDLDFSFRSVKTRWGDIAGPAWRDDAGGAANASGFSITLFASLISWEAQGSGDQAIQIDQMQSSVLSSVSTTSISTTVSLDSNQEQPSESVGHSVIATISTSSQQIIFPYDTYETTTADALGSSSLTVTSTSSVIP